MICNLHYGKRANSSHAPKLGCGCAKYKRVRRHIARQSRRANRP